MKRTALAGLFICAALIAPSAFAAEDLCDTQLKGVENSLASSEAQSEGLKNDIDKLLKDAKAAKAKGTDAGTKDCIELTSQAQKKIDDDQKGDQ
ncbi:hypothetical protein [Pseudomonas sp. ANT_H12B]|uniref:hypothetical protein n=1 Tax=Pseudomonas sp. ANT_H12B TaxID=2597348 RepID=UPI0011ECF7F1|nr:hypothetical protein [Pseudomonas sp. ANT_H12B]KAA0968826.1 hypothetical protein FQ185_19590 [Pseudomonas sp. ANT_H12B]